MIRAPGPHQDGETILAADYVDLQTLRREFIRKVNAAAKDFDAMLMPTTPDTAPPISEVIKDDETYYKINGRCAQSVRRQHLRRFAPCRSLP